MTSSVQSLESPPAAASKWLHCNGHQLKKMARAGLIWLERNHQHVNSLNVFPVPDGDTGTNMLLTMRSAVARVESDDQPHVGKVAAQLSQGALMGARGNSGVILSQIWRGLAHTLADRAEFDAAGLAEALQNASDTAYKGVMRPVEGTILTVIREAAEEAVDAVTKSADLRFVLERVIERSRQAVERTPDLLPILKQAGVVDSGGQGLLYMLEGMLHYANGRLTLDAVPAAAAIPGDKAAAPAQAHAVPESGELEFPYDVQFILLGKDLSVREVRDAIDAMGDSTVVVGDESTIKVHIHVKDPGKPLSYGARLGHVTDVVVENMQSQMEEIVNAEPNGYWPEVEAAAINAVSPDEVSVVAVAAGPGLGQVFRSLGAAHIIAGGQTNNPSTEEIYEAIQATPSDRVIVLPNNKNIFLAAEAARDICTKEVAVVPSQTIPQGLAALMALDPDGDLGSNVTAMTRALPMVATGEMTKATRSVELDGVAVDEGEIIGLVNGKLRSSGDSEAEVFDQVLEEMNVADCGILSIYFGADVTEEQAAGHARRAQELYPDLEVEIVQGGQPHYFYILGAE